MDTLEPSIPTGHLHEAGRSVGAEMEQGSAKNGNKPPIVFLAPMGKKYLFPIEKCLTWDVSFFLFFYFC